MSKTVEIYIGFMEEEVSPLLKTLLNKYRSAIPVFAVSRGTVTEQTGLFERAFDYYGVPSGQGQFLTAVHGSSAALADPVADALQRNFLNGRHNDRVISRVLVEMKDEKDLRAPKVSAPAALTVARLNKDVPVADEDVNGNPIACYVVQSPEMGKQPSIVRAYLRAILKAILEAHPDAKARVVASGAGGGIPMGINPGVPVNIGASLFIGAEADTRGELYAVVDIAGLDPSSLDGEHSLRPLRRAFLDSVLEEVVGPEESAYQTRANTIGRVPAAMSEANTPNIQAQKAAIQRISQRRL